LNCETENGSVHFNAISELVAMGRTAKLLI
jgi:hypothetical protein